MVPLSPDYRLDQRSRLARSLPERGKGTAATGSRRAARRENSSLTDPDMLFSNTLTDWRTLAVSLVQWSVGQRLALAAVLVVLIGLALWAAP
jgi:hypothetical protein